jgi:hypothetical protein
MRAKRASESVSAVKSRSSPGLTTQSESTASPGCLVSIGVVLVSALNTPRADKKQHTRIKMVRFMLQKYTIRHKEAFLGGEKEI